MADQYATRIGVQRFALRRIGVRRIGSDCGASKYAVCEDCAGLECGDSAFGGPVCGVSAFDGAECGGSDLVEQSAVPLRVGSQVRRFGLWWISLRCGSECSTGADRSARDVLAMSLHAVSPDRVLTPSCLLFTPFSSRILFAPSLPAFSSHPRFGPFIRALSSHHLFTSYFTPSLHDVSFTPYLRAIGD